ncbi:MAG: hypothetical protein M3159_07825, partial [Actinomycetota bacterium]|nr:hypothetical protein [Actinomycetota bacterium]
GTVEQAMRNPTQIPVEDGNVTTADPLGLVRALDASDRFQRDSRLGSIFHPGKVSYRETSSTNSLHILIKGNRVSAHVDEVSPLKCTADGSARYAWGPVIAHNFAGLLADVGRRVRGRHGEQRCGLECELVWVDDEFAEMVASGEERLADAGCEGEGPSGP